MSVLARKSVLFAYAFFLIAPALLAKNPSARTHSGIVYDPRTTYSILFGGASAYDSGTRQSYDLGDTWEWTGERWIQLFPANVPPARSAHAMVYDSNRSRILLFGGKSGKETLNDTWVFDSGDWRHLDTPNAPSPRTNAGAAFDLIRDRVILFGGYFTTSDGKTTTNYYDTWEFDGTTWREIAPSGPQLLRPHLVYDAARNQVLMIGVNDKTETLMYSYDGVKGSWSEVKPSTLPTCANDASMTFQSHNSNVLLTEGVCTTSTVAGEVWEWDGTNWNKSETTTKPRRASGAAMTYDVTRQQSLLFGGTVALASKPQSAMWVRGADDWATVTDTSTPAPRSLFAFKADPVNNAIWLFGGINDETSSLDDFWRYQNGQWLNTTLVSGPSSCGSATAAYDRDRARLVVVCVDSTTFEWDGAAWKKFADLKTHPPMRHFSSMVYDAALKKTVLFGGFDNVNYLDQTWLWDGTQWTEAKKNHAPARSLTAMWFDPALKKTLIYGGIGRRSSQDRIERFSDMWSFDGTVWTEMKNVTTPGPRYGAQIALNPKTNHLLVFGGLRIETSGVTQNQVYSGDLWEWDGSAWKKLSDDAGPPARENGALEIDPSNGELVLFAGYAGHFLSDVWVFDGSAWRVKNDAPPPPQPRRRASR